MLNAVKWNGWVDATLKLEKESQKSTLGIFAVALCQNDSSGKSSRRPV